MVVKIDDGSLVVTKKRANDGCVQWWMGGGDNVTIWRGDDQAL